MYDVALWSYRASGISLVCNIHCIFKSAERQDTRGEARIYRSAVRSVCILNALSRCLYNHAFCTAGVCSNL
jgi:hypothetical protein